MTRFLARALSCTVQSIVNALANRNYQFGGGRLTRAYVRAHSVSLGCARTRRAGGLPTRYGIRCKPRIVSMNPQFSRSAANNQRPDPFHLRQHRDHGVVAEPAMRSRRTVPSGISRPSPQGRMLSAATGRPTGAGVRSTWRSPRLSSRCRQGYSPISPGWFRPPPSRPAGK